MRAIVLVKQVPDVRAGVVGTRPDGTIDRASAAAITNPADLHALEAGLQVADEVWALSMGPLRAEATLREAVSLGADRAILLSDRLFAGSDTWATANALEAAIRHVGGADLVLAGVSALDGETGNVGPQVAQRLGFPQATGVEDLLLDGGRAVVRRVIEGGYEMVSLPLPAVMTIVETGFLPRYPTLPGRREAARTPIEVLTASDLGLDETKVGLAASPTKVAHMELVAMPHSDCRFVGEGFEYADLVGELVRRDVFSTSGGVAVSAAVPVASAGRVEEEQAIWVVGEMADGELVPVTAQLIAKASDLGQQLDTGVAAVLVGADVRGAAEEASRFGADLVLVAEDERLERYRGLPETRIVSDAILARSPDVVLFGATTTGRDLAPRIAGVLETGLAADCTDLYIADWERRDVVYHDLLHQVRPAMAGGVLATCLCPEARPQMATVRPGVFPAFEHPRPHRMQRIPATLTEDDLQVQVLERHLQRADVPLADAEVVVAGGAGCGAGNWHLVERLANAIGGRVAASRAAVEAGLAPRALQVGQTGSTVRPRLYIACGISGALQHVVGMKGSGTVIAINRDPDAAIFRFADFGVVGEVAAVLPQLTDAIAAARSL